MTYYEFLFKRDMVALSSAFSYRPTHPYSNQTNPQGWIFPDIFEEEKGWDEVEGKFIYDLIDWPLFFMGLIDRGADVTPINQPAGNAESLMIENEAFRLTSPGRWLLAGGPEPVIARDGGQVVVQPDFTIMAFDPINDAVLQELETFAQRISAERAIQLRLTQKSVYAGQQQGWDANRIQRTLEERTGSPLPANVARSLQEWQTLFERIHISTNVTLLHAVDPADLDLLGQDSELADWLKDRPANGAARISPEHNADAVVFQVQKFGWIPLVTRRQETIPEKSVILDEDGRISFNVKSPNIYLLGYLARFADPDGQAVFRITHASIRRAAASGMTAVQILDALKAVTSTPVAEGLRFHILAWSGHYGQVSLEETTLVTFRDENALAELMKDPELALLMHAIRPSDTRLMVRVKVKDVAKLHKLLEERGVDVKKRD
jgi:hypothetical protein